MGVEPKNNLHVAFFPFMAAGHMIPTLDIAKLFASHHVKTTIITTPYNKPTFTKPLMTYKNPGPPIDIELIPFPSKEAGFPQGLENLEQFTSTELTINFVKALEFFQEPLEQVLDKCKPDCLVADLLFPFATQVASKFNIPRVVFHGTGFFSLCVAQVVMTYQPHISVSSDDEEFIIPHLPHEIKLTRLQMPQDLNKDQQTKMIEFFVRAQEAEAKSYGVIVNSFYELEPDYANHYRQVLCKRAWHIGPGSLCNREDVETKARRGKDSSINEHECLRWLDSKNPNSVIYICFGSLSELPTSQLHEIAMGIEASGLDFIWVVRRNKDYDKQENDEEWLPNGFEKRMENKGLIIRGWAPQVVILEHEAIGGFVTHCGWNSILEGVASGVPMVTWPVFAEQFYNEKLVTEILKIGIAVGAKKWDRIVEADHQVKWRDLKEAMERIIGGEEGLEIRNRALLLKDMARKAVEIGGSSYSDLESLIHELSNYHI